MEPHNYISSWKCTQIPAKTVKRAEKFEKNIRFPHNIAHLIVEEGWRRRARDKLRELYSELFTEIVLQLGRVYILSLSARTFLFWISLVSQFYAPEVNCRNNSSTKELYSLCPLNVLNNNSRCSSYISTYLSKHANETTCQIKRFRHQYQPRKTQYTNYQCEKCNTICNT